MHTFDAIILGAGAAGLLCAVTAGKRGISCAVVDHGPAVGNKIRMAGGGRGNVTNLRIGPEWYVGEDPSFVRLALRRCPPNWVLDLLHSYSIPWEERNFTQIFCTVPSARLAESLATTARENGARFFLSTRILTVERADNGLFRVRAANRTTESTMQAPRLVLAMGSPACPASGATDQGIRLAHTLGHRIVPFRPALVPLLFPDSWSLAGLAGISLDAGIGVDNHTFTYPLLFTHRGLSGPAILQASCFWRKGLPLHINFLPEISALDVMHDNGINGRTTVLGLFRKLLPDRLAERLIPEDLAPCRIAELGKDARRRVAVAVHDHVVVPLRAAGMDKAEAAAGGVATLDINPRTMESRLCPGLYFAGEIMDVTGLLGGYNLHWAWASGKAAGEALK